MNAIKLVCITVILFPVLLSAGNIQVKSARITELNRQKKYAYVTFDLSWQNSWRCDKRGQGFSEPYNYDAAWVFLKFKDTMGQWRHSSLSPVSRSHRASANSVIEAVYDGKGVFVYAQNNFSGAADYKDLKLKWNFGTDSVDINESCEIKVLAVEMVYIPEGSFYAGDGSSYGSFFSGSNNTPAIISSKSVLLKAGKNSFDDDELLRSGISVEGTGGIKSPEGGFENPDYPTGYNSFYMMKYEISQGEYSSFLNLITKAQAKKRFLNSAASYRNTISLSKNLFTAQRPLRACNFLSWMDGAAFADWTGLRPMTELEYEKACRGYNNEKSAPNPFVKKEYAWGNNETQAARVITGSEDGSERADGNASFGFITFKGGDGELGPLRCGIFEINSFLRTAAGKSYYGACELSGNLLEQCVTIGNTAGRSFRDFNGDGLLSAEGDADVSYWPGINGNSSNDIASIQYIGQVVSSPGITEASGSGQRGGSWYTKEKFLSVSDRSYASSEIHKRLHHSGFRCVRSEK